MGKFEPQQFRDELVVEQEKKIPELFVYENSPVLQVEAIKVLKEQWEKFWELRFAKHEVVVPEEAVQNLALLKNGTLLHNLSYDEATLSKILQSGILSGELGYGEKETVAEDSETNYCADFYVNQGDKSVQEYIEYATGSEETDGLAKKRRTESYKFPRERNDSISIVVDPSKPGLADLLQYSATGVDASRLVNFSVRFPYGADKPDIAKRHLAVLVGIPANYISLLVVGGKIASDLEKLAKLKGLIESSGLDISILNFRGEKI